MKCRHCHTNKAIQDKRLLCFACYMTPAIRRLYPSRVANENRETMEELDALIAEQMRPENLPSWWNRPYAQDDDE